MTTTTHKLLSTWTIEKQTAWRQRHPQDVLLFHLLLDASPSMIPHAEALLDAYNRYVRWLQHAAPPMSLAETRCFSGHLDPGKLEPLGILPPLTREGYRPEHGHGTALYNAVGQVCTTPRQPGQHILVVFTDGADCATDDTWTTTSVGTLLTTLQEQDGWLCVFLGAFPHACLVAQAMGFYEGNILEFATDRLPEAFLRLQQGTQRFLRAGPVERKLLTAGGVF